MIHAEQSAVVLLRNPFQPSQREVMVAHPSQTIRQWLGAQGIAEFDHPTVCIKNGAPVLRADWAATPIDGVVLTRAVEPGYAVAATLQAVTLFTLAEDLAQLRLDVNVDEADVGQVKEGQQATYTVDAWPGREYPSTITRDGYGSQEQDGVISYKTVLTVVNDDLSLRPGMTATAEIVTARRDDVLLAPNAALRYAPPAGAPAAQPARGVVGNLMPRPPAPAQRPAGAPAERRPQQLWILQDGTAVPLAVSAGASDGTHTEVSGEGLREGLQVITERVETPP